MDSKDKRHSHDTELRRRAEELALEQATPSPQDIEDMSPEEVHKTLHQLRVYQIELEMQNEELRQAQLALDALRARYFDLYDLAPVGYLTVNEHGLIQQGNLNAAVLLGLSRGALIKQPVSRFIFKEDQDSYYLHCKQLVASGAAQSCDLRLVRHDGALFWAQLKAIVGQDSGTPVIRLVLSDITERKRYEEELRIAAVAFASQNAMMITDPDGIILRVNPAFIRLTGYSSEEAVGQTIELLNSGQQDRQFYQRMWSELKVKGAWRGEIWNKRKHGQIYAELLNITAIFMPDKDIVTHYVASFSDITEDKEAEAEIHRLAYYDPLTKLPNRRLLQDRLSQAIVSSARSNLYGAIFFIDLDNFKELNDTRGHDIGDLLLIEVAQRLRMAVREGDTVARLGGDEFVVVMENLAADPKESATMAKHLGDKLQEAIDRPFTLKSYEYSCKISIGVGLFDGRDTAEGLFKRADLALYLAKSSGRNTLRFYDPAMQIALDQSSAMEAELRRAVNLKQFLLYYQPQVDFTHRVIGAEALLRWQHPQLGLVQPGDFIPLAEDTGLTLAIGLWVLETACALLKTWEDDARTRELYIAVNVSVRQFRQADFVSQVKRVVASSGANPARLKLELTESLVLKNVEDTIVKMQALKSLGVNFAIDDFGTGYSSLSDLAQLPLDQLKIDRSFVSKLPGNSRDETLVRTIITMGKELAINVIAEGVETEAQQEFLELHGCRVFQGDLFSRPLPPEKIEALLKRVSRTDKAGG